MFRLLGKHPSWPPFLKSMPGVPVAASCSSEAPSNPLEANSVANNGVAVVGSNGNTGEKDDHASPLTFGKVFNLIPRMTKAMNTPVINQRISAAFGLPVLENSLEFKKIYASGRDILR